MKPESLTRIREELWRKLGKAIEKARVCPELLTQCEALAIRARLAEHLLSKGYTAVIDALREPLLPYRRAMHPYPDEVLKALSDLQQFINRVGTGYILVNRYDDTYVLEPRPNHLYRICLLVKGTSPQPFISSWREVRDGKLTLLTLSWEEFLEEI